MKIVTFGIILILSFFAIFPFFHNGFFPIHDNTQVARVYEMTKALQDGMLPVRWSQNLGYGFGYPIFNFYDPLAYYIGGFIGTFGANALLSTKLMMALGIIFSSFSMYILAREFWGKWGGILSALFYAYAPYHAVDIYVRGDVAEFWAYAFLPLIFYGLWKIRKEYKWKYVVLTSLSYAAVIISHNLTALITTPFILLFIFYLLVNNKKSKKKLNIYLLSSFILGILVSAFYSISAILEMKYTNVLSQVGGGANFKDHFVCLSQLWTSPWGFGGSAKGCIDGVSFMIGKYHIIFSVSVFVLAVIFLFSKRFQGHFSDEKEKLWIITASFLGILISIFFTLEVSRPIWELIKPMAFIQYPWRFLLLISFFSSFVAGAVFLWIDKFIEKKQLRTLISISLCIFIVLVSAKFFVPQKYLNNNSESYTSIYALSWNASKISSEYMPKNFQKPKTLNSISNFSDLSSDSLRIDSVNIKTQEIDIKFNANNNIAPIIPLAYFPAWKAFVDNKNTLIKEEKKGISVKLPEGIHNLRLVYKQTFVEVFSNLISLSSILCLFIGIIYFKKKYE